MAHMKDEVKSKGQLIKELVEMRQRVAELSVSNANQRPANKLPFDRQTQIFSSIVDIANEAIITVDDAQRIVLFNSGAERIFGYSFDEVLDQPLDILLPERFVAIHRQHIIDFANSDVSARLKNERPAILGRRKNGQEFPATASISKIKVGTDRFFTVILRDITERKQAEEELYRHRDYLEEIVAERTAELTAINAQLQQEITERELAEAALRQSEEHLRQVITSISDHIYMAVYEGDLITDSKPTKHYISPNIEALTGYPQEEFVADWHFWRSLIHPDDWDLAAFQPKHFSSSDVSQVEYRLHRADGSIIWVRDNRRVKFEPKDTNRSQRITVYGVVSNISEHKQLEDQLSQSQKMEAIGRLAGGIAHDFNNLLTVITGYSEILLERHLKEDPIRQEVEQIKRAGKQAASLTRQLLAFSRKQVLQPKILDLNDVVSDIEQMLQRVIGEDIDLISVLEKNLGRVKADPGQVEQVIMNLAVNARDAMPQGGKLTIGTANIDLDETYTRRHVGVKPGPYIMLALSDNGHGMDAATKARIFEPFFTTKEQGHGTGLGLATVHGIVNQSGGHIWIYSEPGRGSSFKIYLPRVEEATEPSSKTYAPASSFGGSETILLAEDDDMVRELAHCVLLEKGYTVVEAQDGDEALQISEQYTNPIQLLVTDVVMPGGMSGRQLADKLVSIHPEMKVLYISGYTDNAIVHHGVLDPEMAFLEKPFTPHALVRKAREVLDSA